MPDYEASSLTALQTLLNAGRVLVMRRRKPENDYDPVLGAVPEPEEPPEEPVSLWDEWNVVGVTLPATAGKIQGFENKSTDLDKLVLTRVRFLILSAKGPDGTNVHEPAPEDRLTLDGTDWRVVGCTRLNINGTPIIYKIGVTA